LEDFLFDTKDFLKETEKVLFEDCWQPFVDILYQQKRADIGNYLDDAINQIKSFKVTLDKNLNQIEDIRSILDELFY
jgi:hypothetical protein